MEMDPGNRKISRKLARWSVWGQVVICSRMLAWAKVTMAEMKSMKIQDMFWDRILKTEYNLRGWLVAGVWAGSWHMSNQADEAFAFSNQYLTSYFLQTSCDGRGTSSFFLSNLILGPPSISPPSTSCLPLLLPVVGPWQVFSSHKL